MEHISLPSDAASELETAAVVDANSTQTEHSTKASVEQNATVTVPFAFLPDRTRAVLAKQGINAPTLIQEKAIPIALEGRDVLAQSHTGSGKTLAFGLSLGLRLTKAKRGGVLALVLTPTRELATQVTRVLEPILRTLDLSVLAVTGGDSYSRQKSALHRGVDVVVGTPGRICDLLSQDILTLENIQMFVLDEVDEMLDVGFADNLEEIRAKVGPTAQALFFSATLNPKIRKLARTLLNDPVEVVAKQAAEGEAGAARIEHGYIEVLPGGEFKALINAFLFHSPEQALVFCKTRAECAELVEALVSRGLLAAALHGDLSQDERNATMAKFRDKRVRYLVATNVAARGIDVRDLPLVVNFGVPFDPESYTHRVGRTGRAGAEGKAWTLVSPKTARGYEFLMRHLKLTPTAVAVPAPADIARRIAEETVKGLLGTPDESTGPKTVRKAVERALEDIPAEEKAALLSALLCRHVGQRESFFLNDVVPTRPVVRLGAAATQSATFNDRPRFGERRSFGERKPFGDKKPFGKPFGSKPAFGDKKPYGDKAAFGEKKPHVDKKPFFEKKTFVPSSVKPAAGKKPAFRRDEDWV